MIGDALTRQPKHQIGIARRVWEESTHPNIPIVCCPPLSYRAIVRRIQHSPTQLSIFFVLAGQQEKRSHPKQKVWMVLRKWHRTLHRQPGQRTCTLHEFVQMMFT